MGAFEDIFHSGRDRRNRQGYQGNYDRNQMAPDPYGGGYRQPMPDRSQYGLGSNFDLERYNRDMAAYEASYQQNNVTFDETGRPIVNGRPISRPGADYALDYQYLAEQEAERRRLSLWGDAQNAIRQGLDLFQSYRPGGSAALASGMFQQSASMYGTQALNTFAPDMLSEYRNKQLEDAKRERERARDFSERLALGQFAMNPAGILGSGLTPQPAAAAPTETPPSPGTPTTPTAPSGGTVPAGGTGAATVQGGPGASVLPGGGGASPIEQMGGYMAPGGPGGQQMTSSVNRAGGAGGATVDGGFGAGGSAGGPVGAGGSRARASGAGPGGGGGGMGIGGGPPLASYTGQEAATRSQMGAPLSTDAATSSWAGSGLRSESVALRVSSARTELLDAIGWAASPVSKLATLLI